MTRLSSPGGAFVRRTGASASPCSSSFSRGCRSKLRIGGGLVGSTVSATSPYCHVAYGVLTQLRGLGAYTIPKIDLQVSGVFQSKPGALLSANYAVPNTVVAQSLG